MVYISNGELAGPRGRASPILTRRPRASGGPGLGEASCYGRGPCAGGRVQGPSVRTAPGALALVEPLLVVPAPGRPRP